MATPVSDAVLCAVLFVVETGLLCVLYAVSSYFTFCAFFVVKCALLYFCVTLGIVQYTRTHFAGKR